jgi:hypothetical protein
MFNHQGHRHHHHRDQKDFAWYELHAGEIFIEPDPRRMIELLRFLASDQHTFHRLKDTLMHRAYNVLDALEHLEYQEPPKGTSYNHGR